LLLNTRDPKPGIMLQSAMKTFSRSGKRALKNPVPLILMVPMLLCACYHTSPVTITEVPLPKVESPGEIPSGIPSEYIPAPGKCRFWYPDRSPDKQPEPERCLEIAANVPPGAWLVYGGSMVKTYRIEQYDPQNSETGTVIRYYELESGRFLREERVCE